MAKAQSVISDPKVIYISWLQGEEKVEVKTWVDQFYEKVTASTASFADFRASRTGDELPGACKTVEQFLPTVTDIVGVLTDKYAIEIQKKNDSSSPAELNKFFKLRLEDKADSGSRRAWITPLQMLPLAKLRVEGVPLVNKQYCWLVLMEDTRKKGRFPWPDEPACNDEIFYAVKEILGEILD